MLGQLGLYGPLALIPVGSRCESIEWVMQVITFKAMLLRQVFKSGHHSPQDYWKDISVLCRSRRLIKDYLLILVTFRGWKSFAICECFSRLTNVGKRSP